MDSQFGSSYQEPLKRFWEFTPIKIIKVWENLYMYKYVIVALFITVKT